MTIKKFSQAEKVGRVRIRKSAVSGIWQIKYENPLTKKYVEKSTKTTRKSEAKQIAEHLSLEIINQNLGVADGSIPLESLFKRFVDAKKLYFRKESVKRIRSSKKVFMDWINTEHPEVCKAKDITVQIARDFQAHRINQGRAKRTVDNDICNLHTVFLWAINEQLVKSSPFAYSRGNNLSLFKDSRVSKRDVYTPEQYEALVVAAEAKGDTLTRDLIILFANTGMRFGEAANLVPQALIWDRDIPMIEIKARNGWLPKSPNSERLIPMNSRVEAIMRRREANANGGYLFQNLAGNQIVAHKTREKLQALFPEVGIDPSQRLHWHSWRNFFIIKCIKSHVDIHSIMSWVGHDSMTMIHHYMKVRDNTNAHAAEFEKLL